jgi:hypothetical protein
MFLIGRNPPPPGNIVYYHIGGKHEMEIGWGEEGFDLVFVVKKYDRRDEKKGEGRMMKVES